MESQENIQLFRRDPKGKYQLLFLNTAGLGVEEIIRIFSKFGKVDYVKVCGDKTGYRFVKFGSIDEVEKAIEGLKYDPLIKLIPPDRRREKSKTRNENDNQNNQERNHKGINTKNSNTNAENGASIWNNNDGNSQTNNVSKKSENIEDFSQTQLRKSNLSNSSKKKSFKSSLRSQTSVEEIPDIVPNKKETFVNDMIKKKVIIDAEEVIIGNIPINYTAPYFLHLLDNFEPIAVSNINAIPESSIRYCHVYLKSIKDCQEVERLFDRVELSGKKLIVQRPCNLMASAFLN